MKQPRRILIVRPDRIGDVIMATPLIRTLRQTYPEAFIAALVRPHTAPLLQHNPRLDRILVDDFEGADRGRKGFRRKVRELRKLKFDTALMLLPTERHTWMTFLAGIRTRVSVGTRPYHVLTFTRTVSRNKYIPLRHEADYCMDLGRVVGADSDNLDAELFLTNEEEQHMREALQSMGWNLEQPLATVFPETGGSAPGWAVGSWADFVARILEERDDVFVLVDVVPGREQVRAAFQTIDSPRMLLSPGTSDLREVMAMIAASTVVVSASTGPMHMAAALKIPTVTQFCPLPACSPRLWGPRGNLAKIVLPPDGYCREKCPGDPHVCSFEGGIGLDEMLSAVVEVLDELDVRERNRINEA